MSVTLAAADGGARLVVEDDGCGFDPAVARRSAHGLVGMRYRVLADGGRFGLSSAPGNGTRLVGTLPGNLAEKAAESEEILIKGKGWKAAFDLSGAADAFAAMKRCNAGGAPKPRS